MAGATEVRTDPLIGTTLGKDYFVLEEIGRGGMAVVYLVEHQTLQKRFAAKVLSVELAANAEARARFTQEAHAASQLDHENIVTISDFGVSPDRRPYFVMELLRGATLDQRVAAGPMTLEEVVAVTVPVARALAHAHAEGVVHRDVKPENIFLVQRSQGRWGVKVVDFGIAKAPINTRLTKMGQTLGSPMFMAPEACRGEEVDHRADIYSLGILLYLMVCGRVPFEDESLLKVLQLQSTAPLIPPRELAPGLSLELAAVIEQALEKEPDARFQSMTELLDAFEAAVPPEAMHMLMEVQRGTTAAVRTTPYPGVTRVSQPLPTVSSSREVPSFLPPAPARSRGKLIALVAVVLSMLFAAAGIGFAVMNGSKDPEQPAPAPAPVVAPAPPVAPVPTHPRSTGATTPDPTPTTTPTTTDPAVPAPVATTVHLDIRSVPSRAKVTLDGKSLGLTPVSTDVPRAEREGVVELERDGYQGLKRSIDLRGDSRFELALVEEESRSRRSSRSRSKPTTSTKPEPSRGSSRDDDLDIRTSR